MRRKPNRSRASRTRDYARGNADDALRTAAVVTDLRYSIMRNNHNPMEIPATVASWDGDRLTVWDKVQSISGAQKTYADAFGVPGDKVRVISPFVGGAFGSAGTTWPHQLLAAFAARQMRRPVKLVLTSKQYYSGIGYRPTSRQRMAIGADRSGRINAIVHEAHTETSRYNAYEDNLMTGPRFLYGSPNMRSTYRVVPLDINPPTYMRGPGATTGAFALESAMDDLAFRLGMDPIELRLRNEPDRDRTDESAVLHAPAHRLLPAGRRRVRLVTPQPDAARYARRQPTDRHRHGRGGLSHLAQRVCGAGPDQRRRHRRRSVRHERHGPRHLHVDDAGGRRRARAAVATGCDSRSATAGFPRRRRTRVRGRWRASGRRCSRRPTCCATGSCAPRSSIPARH